VIMPQPETDFPAIFQDMRRNYDAYDDVSVGTQSRQPDWARMQQAFNQAMEAWRERASRRLGASEDVATSFHNPSIPRSTPPGPSNGMTRQPGRSPSRDAYVQP
jgi:hypothetical protein